jgi:large subunit ribosomal protein L24
VSTTPSNIPISAIRLVHPVRDEETGQTRDVVIRQLEPVDIYEDKPTREVLFERMVPGLRIQIPWPPKEEEQHTDHKADTLRIKVEERTFVPTLLRPPMPDTVIDELRNRYSKFRTRHTPEYVAAKEAEEREKKERIESAAKMRLPLHEFHMKQRAERRARGQPMLTNEMLAKIGEVMERTLNQRQEGIRLAELLSREVVVHTRSKNAAEIKASGSDLVQAVEQLSLGVDDDVVETPPPPPASENHSPPL